MDYYFLPIILIVVVILIMISYFKEDRFFAVLAGFLIVIFGIYIAINGLDYEDPDAVDVSDMEVYYGCLTDFHNGTEISFTELDKMENSTDIELCETGVYGFTLTDGVGLTAEFPGVYTVDYSLSLSGGANTHYHVVVAVNDLIYNHTMSDRKIGSGGDVGNTGGTGILNISSGDLIHLQIGNLQNTKSMFVEHISLVVERIR